MLRSPSQTGRLLALLALGALLAGCPGSSADESQAGADDGADPGAGYEDAPTDEVCQVDTDCVAVASTCCECPSFAVLGDSDPSRSCDDLDCEVDDGPVLCPALEPACDQGACTLRCAPIAAESVCDFGYQRDAAGCLVDACAEPTGVAASCTLDSDCVQTRADCCGCARGGEDTAVPVAEAEAFDDALACNDTDACPEIDVCEAGAVPRCLGGRCALVVEDGDSGGPEPMSEGMLCGTADLPPCASGMVCVLNDPDAPHATELGVGVCRSR